MQPEQVAISNADLQSGTSIGPARRTAGGLCVPKVHAAGIALKRAYGFPTGVLIHLPESSVQAGPKQTSLEQAQQHERPYGPFERET